MSYDFRNLSPHDFQGLIGDLLREEFGCNIESFPPGPDGGIDNRHHATDLVVQCKHFAGSTRSTLLSSLKKERANVDRLKPKRYIVATSVALTPNAKQQIFDLFEPYLKDQADILGRDCINALLRKHPSVERTHFKLWLTSSTVLDRVVHSSVFGRTEDLLEEIERKLQVYVQNNAFGRAQQILESQSVCIVSGIPGIGKTTLAEILLVDHVHRGFEPIAVSGDISEAESVYRRAKRQVFFYDDFLGQTSLADKLTKNEDARLVKFMERVRDDKNKRFILTTREYILAAACGTYEPLARGNLDPRKCVLALQDYSRYERARILYNHLYFSQVTKESLEALLVDKQYYRIIDHSNYSPRLVERVTALAQDRCDCGQRFVDRFVEVLDTPYDLWQHPYDNQLSSEAKAILLALATMPTPAKLESLQVASKALFQKWHGRTAGEHQVRSALKVLEGNFVRFEQPRVRLHGTDEIGVTLHNPSIRDFLIATLDREPGAWLHALETAACFDHVETVWSFICQASRDSVNQRRRVLQQLKRDPQPLVDAYVRTLFSRNCRATFGRLSDFPSTSSGRLAHLVGRFEADSTIPLSALDPIVEAWAANKESFVTHRYQATFALKRLERANFGSKTTRINCWTTIANVVKKSLDTFDDYELLLELRQLQPRLVSDGEIREYAKAFKVNAEYYVDEIVNSSDDVEHLEERASVFAKVSNALGVEVDDSDIHQRIADLETEDDDDREDYAYDKSEWYGLDDESNTDNDTIDAMFQTLSGD